MDYYDVGYINKEKVEQLLDFKRATCHLFTNSNQDLSRGLCFAPPHSRIIPIGP